MWAQIVGVGAALGAYALAEPHLYRFQRHVLPLRPGAPSLSVLHVSDLHLSRKDRRRAGFLRSLPDRIGDRPDLVLMTGDVIEDDLGIDPALDALAGLRAGLGRFYVLGSHDYYQARFKPPTRYLIGQRGDPGAPPADVARLEAGLADQGWVSLSNRTEILAAPDGAIRLAGVDDPYLNRHRTDHIRRADGEVLAIGLTHAPDVVSEWALAGFDLILAGHTHGGQLRVPGIGALVTNSDLTTELAMGPNRVGHAWLHVSPGLGTSKYAPIRFLARPEVTLLELRGDGKRF